MSERSPEDHALRRGQETTLPRRSHSSAFVEFVTNPEPAAATSATAPAPIESSMSPEDADHDALDWSDEENLDRLVGVPGESRSRKRQKLPKGSLNLRGIAACQEFSTEAFLGKYCNGSATMRATINPIAKSSTCLSNSISANIAALFLEEESRRKNEPRQKTPPPQAASPLFRLPREILHQVLSWLDAQELATASLVCRGMSAFTSSDLHWRRCVQRNVPGIAIKTSGPCTNYRELYAAHEDVWFLPKYKLWFADQDLTGRLILARYDQQRGCIEGYQLLASSKNTVFAHWPENPRVIIHEFDAEVKLHLDKPILHFPLQRKDVIRRLANHPDKNRFAHEIPMTLGRKNTTFNNFSFVRPLESSEADRKLAMEYPYDHVWPPPSVPARHYVSGAGSGQGMITPLTDRDKPTSRAEVSDQAFRIRQWVQLGGFPDLGPNADTAEALELVIRQMQGGNGASMGINLGENIVTYSTLDPALYTPTKTKPWRGIWVGDYSGHGCEFLLINQPDDPPATNEELGVFRKPDESESEWEQRQLDAQIYRGRLEAIKLTGDPNIPRGEYTFLSDDIGPAGYVGIGNPGDIFEGAHIVKSKGHVAATGFLRGKHYYTQPLSAVFEVERCSKNPDTDEVAGLPDKYIESRLILISPNKIAQYWVEFGHISYFERVEIDPFLDPDYRPPEVAETETR